MTFNLADLWERVADSIGDRIALVSPSVSRTFGEVDRRADTLAAKFSELGVARGRTVALATANHPDYFDALFATFKLGAIPVNLNRQFVADEHGAVLRDANLAAIFTDAELGDSLRAVVSAANSSAHIVERESVGHEIHSANSIDATPAPRPTSAGRSGDDHYVIYTSGTTGRPKGVIWRHEDLFFAALGGGNLAGPPILEPDEVVAHLAPSPARTLIASPLTHGTAQWAALTALLSGHSVVVTATSGFDPFVVLDLAANERASHLVLVGDAFALPLADALSAEPLRWNLDNLVVIASGGAPLSQPVVARLLSLLPGAVVSDGYGSSETGGHGRRILSPGVSAPLLAQFRIGPDTAVLDDASEAVSPGSGDVGRLARRGRIAIGFTNADGADRIVIDTAGTRWMCTNDLARVEDDGMVTLLGRRERLINTGGEKVHPAEVEAVLRAHPAIRDIVVIGVPHARFGEEVTALVEQYGEPITNLADDRRDEPVTIEDIRGFCRGRLSAFKLPRRLVVTEAIPRTSTGKINLAAARLIAGPGEVPGGTPDMDASPQN